MKPARQMRHAAEIARRLVSVDGLIPTPRAKTSSTCSRRPGCSEAPSKVTKDHFLAMVGDNTFLRHLGKMMTINLKQCDADRIYYASKILWKYPEDYLMFGFRD